MRGEFILCQEKSSINCYGTKEMGSYEANFFFLFWATLISLSSMRFTSIFLLSNLGCS